MKSIIFIFSVLVILVSYSYAQRILVNENFETTGFGIDSLPINWVKENVDTTCGDGKQWAVRDTGTHYKGTSFILVAKAHNSVRALTIPFSSGNPIADDWAFTKTFLVQTGDSLIFWMLIGSPIGYLPYLDTMQVWTMHKQRSIFTIQKLATIKSNDSLGMPLSTNTWMQHKFDLSSFAGQTICIAFRYFMNTSVDGFWCNIDDVFIGNRAYVGITQIGSNVPKDFGLSQNYPNPFNPTTKIKFEVPKNTNVKIEVFNNLGQVVKVLHDGFTNAGYYETDFNASSLNSGIYYYRMTAGMYVQTKKMVLVK